MPQIACLVFALSLLSLVASTPQPNPPVWPTSVHIFGPEDGDAHIKAVFDNVSAPLNNRHTGHFSTQREAFLFKPGTYTMDLLVGYYVQVAGLGKSADDVVIQGKHGVHCFAMDDRPHGAGSLDTFWRAAENFRSASPQMTWAVSQAAPLRRVHVDGDLLMHDRGLYASGGFMANMQVDGYTVMGSQQQWFTRNADMKPDPRAEHMYGAWSFVFVGSPGAPDTYIPEGAGAGPRPTLYQGKSISNIPVTPVYAEKPFLSIESNGTFTLEIPQTQFDGAGSDLSPDNLLSVPFEKVFVARAEVDDAQSIQAMLDLGLHVVLSPGIYTLTDSLTMKFPGQTLLGIGLASLIAPETGKPCIAVQSGVPGVRIAGIMMQASDIKNAGSVVGVSTLLEWGEPNVEDPGDASDPGYIFDLFARVGGPNVNDVQVDMMVRLHSGNVIGDNLWLWRADHSLLRGTEKAAPGEEYHLVTLGEYRVETGLEVLGANVSMYGLAVEHTVGNLVHWKGEEGRLYFFQSELPYDVTQESFADKGYAGYHVDDSVLKHTAYGVGVYSFFRDHQVLVPSAITAPNHTGITFVNTFTRHLNGYGGIMGILNGDGPATGPSMGRIPLVGTCPDANCPGPTHAPTAAPTPPLTPVPTGPPSPPTGAPTKSYCPGTFLGQDGTHYACQYAIDKGWGASCDDVSAWKNANCVAPPLVPPPSDNSSLLCHPAPFDLSHSPYQVIIVVGALVIGWGFARAGESAREVYDS